MGKILLQGMRFKSHIGVYDYEQQYGNNFSVDVEVSGPQIDGEDDQLVQTIDYARIYSIVQDVMGSHCHLIETACKSILERIVQEDLTGNHTVVRIHKLHPPLGGEVDQVGIEMEWNKFN